MKKCKKQPEDKNIHYGTKRAVNLSSESMQARAGGAAQIAEHLQCKYEALSQTPEPAKKFKKRWLSQAPMAHTCNPS
jgi:hypothetical protein